MYYFRRQKGGFIGEHHETRIGGVLWLGACALGFVVKRFNQKGKRVQKKPREGTGRNKRIMGQVVWLGSQRKNWGYNGRGWRRIEDLSKGKGLRQVGENSDRKLGESWGGPRPTMPKEIGGQVRYVLGRRRILNEELLKGRNGKKHEPIHSLRTEFSGDPRHMDAKGKVVQPTEEKEGGWGVWGKKKKKKKGRDEGRLSEGKGTKRILRS